VFHLHCSIRPQITQISQSAAEPQPKSIDESAVADGSIKPGRQPQVDSPKIPARDSGRQRLAAKIWNIIPSWTSKAVARFASSFLFPILSPGAHAPGFMPSPASQV